MFANNPCQQSDRDAHDHVLSPYMAPLGKLNKASVHFSEHFGAKGLEQREVVRPQSNFISVTEVQPPLVPQ